MQVLPTAVPFPGILLKYLFITFVLNTQGTGMVSDKQLHRKTRRQIQCPWPPGRSNKGTGNRHKQTTRDVSNMALAHCLQQWEAILEPLSPWHLHQDWIYRKWLMQKTHQFFWLHKYLMWPLSHELKLIQPSVAYGEIKAVPQIRRIQTIVCDSRPALEKINVLHWSSF